MILVDERVGSRELLAKIRAYGADAEIGGKLDADFQFVGNGPDGEVLVGVERKAIQDLLNSMRDRRLAGGQIGRMAACYDVLYLVVEGIWRRGRSTGLIEVRNGDWHPARGSYRYSETARFLASLRELAGLRIWRTSDEEETAGYVAEEYAWWQKEWKDHRTADAIYAPQPERKTGHRAKMFRTEATVLEKWLCALPRIDSRAGELAKEFMSPLDMALADVDRWIAIKGIGKKTAEGIVEAIGG